VPEKNSLAFIESLGCLSSWLQIVLEGNEVSSGIQRWYLAEKKATASRRGIVYSPEASSLQRLPKIVFRLDDLDSSLRKLSHVLRAGSKSVKQSKSFCEQTEFFDRLVSPTTVVNRGAFSSQISAKLKFLAQEQKRVEADFGLAASTKKRKSTPDIESHIRKERRRRVVRSRNELVDRWLQSDSKTGVEEAQNQDAFNDLEDFLVDG